MSDMNKNKDNTPENTATDKGMGAAEQAAAATKSNAAIDAFLAVGKKPKNDPVSGAEAAPESEPVETSSSSPKKVTKAAPEQTSDAVSEAEPERATPDFRRDLVVNDGPKKCGVVAIIGAPNAGKSTLVNQLVGQKVAIISNKAQTTRTRLLGIAIHGNTQFVLADTPGIFTPQRRLDRAMVSAAWEGTEAADAIVLMVDPIKQRRHDLEPLLEILAGRKERKILVINKVDISKKEPMLELAQDLDGKVDFEKIFFVSAKSGDGVGELLELLDGMMPESEWHYPEEQVSDASERLLACEVTREQLYRQLHEELPYASTVRPESYTQRKDGSVEVRQQIVIARPSQKPIVLGKGGSRIKAIGEAARMELSQILGCKVHLFLHVKVDENWDETRELYDEMGLDWVK